MARRRFGALVVASATVVVAGAMAATVGATPSSAAATTAISYDTGRRSTPPHAGAPGPGPVARPETQTQTIRLEIRGGELTVEPRSLTVALSSDGDVLRGTIPAITVVDARGTLEGWHARVRMVDVVGVDSDGSTLRVPPGQVVLTPAEPSIVAGTPEGVAAGRPVRGRGNGTLLRAAPSTGGGTFVGGGTIEIARSADTVAATVTLAVAVG